MSRILVVDDEEGSRSVIEEFLRSKGYEVETFESGPPALAALEKSPFDLLVLDIYLPGMDGIEILREVRKRHPKLPVIAISGGGRQGSLSPLAAASRLGADATFPKPLEFETFLTRVADLLART